MSGRHTLADMKPGERGRIVRVAAKSGMLRRLAEMGVTREAPVRVVRLAPLGDPMEIEVRGYHLSLRRSEARHIEVARGGGT